MNPEQLKAFSTILDRVGSGKSGVFFVDDPGGTRKTYLYRALLAHLRSNDAIAIATTTSRVAAHISPGGHIAHLHFKIPLETHDGSFCNIKIQSGLADLLRIAKLILWDEAPMAKRWAIESLHLSLGDIVGNKELPFGGKMIVLGGNYRQVLSVVPKGTIQQTIGASLVSSDLWYIMEKFTLSTNMKERHDTRFCEFLLRIGNGEEKTNDEGNIQIPKEMIVEYDNDEESEQ